MFNCNVVTRSNRSSDGVNRILSDGDMPPVKSCKKNIGVEGMCTIHLLKTIKIGKEVGSGFHSKVFKCTINGHIYALKVFRKKYNKNSIEREWEALINLNHPNVITLYKVLQMKKNGIFLLDYTPKDLFNEIEKSTPVEKAPNYLFQLIKGLEYLHSRGYIHRDIKAENCLLTRTGILKICDFDTAINTVIYDGSGHVGTTEYLAPEVKANSKVCTNKVDIWAIGILACELYTGSTNLKQTLKKPLPKNLKIFIRNCTKLNPIGRPTATQLLEYDYLKDN